MGRLKLNLFYFKNVIRLEDVYFGFIAKQLKTHYNQIASAFIPGNQYKKFGKEQKLEMFKQAI